MSTENAVTKIDREPEQNLPAAPITPMQMLQMAVEQDADLDKLTKLMDLQERWEANEARKAFVAARAAFKAEAPTVAKNKNVHFTSQKGTTDYDHATLDNVAETLSPVLAKHDLSFSWETEQLDGGTIRVTCILTHVLGHSEKVTLQAGADQSGNKNNIQAVGSTVTYLQRYTLLAVTGTATGDMDDDGDKGGMGDLISPEQKDQIIAKMKDVGADTAAFLKYMGFVAVDAIPAKEFDRTMAALEQKRKAAEKSKENQDG